MRERRELDRPLTTHLLYSPQHYLFIIILLLSQSILSLAARLGCPRSDITDVVHPPPFSLFYLFFCRYEDEKKIKWNKIGARWLKLRA